MKKGNTENNRKEYPDRNLYTCYTTMGANGLFCLKNNNNKLIYEFQSEEDKNNHAQIMIAAIYTIYTILLTEYYNDKSINPNKYKPMYSELNFIGKAINNGFTPTINKNKFRSNDNWFGVSCYSPDEILINGSKKIQLSLQGIGMPMPLPTNMSEKFLSVLTSCSCKYIAFIEDNNVIYESYFGQLPENDFIEKFITNV